MTGTCLVCTLSVLIRLNVVTIPRQAYVSFVIIPYVLVYGHEVKHLRKFVYVYVLKNSLFFLISDFPRVNVVCFLLGCSPAYGV
jgi:hypothetical protein